MEKIMIFLKRKKYEILLLALVQHLYTAIFFKDLVFYMQYIWPINTMLLGLASVGVFIERGKWKIIIRNILLVIVILLPVCHSLFKDSQFFIELLSLIYMVFFALIFWEVIKFLIKPSYVNADIIFAAACGYFMLIEISVFVLQFEFYRNTASITNLNTSTLADTYLDLVYLASIIQTTIGFGDITPSIHVTKLTTSFLGVISQFYNVVLVGILISKYSSYRKS
ncbi:two pore domain potassium channel family protein [Echinicola sp. CAU 1574]|uniref:Two pore domain potassium channel family protein n=1 Tax=Echinicola arenosa TaxID=2774144 RepID=A0ABR9AJD2_9BACT|nr:ion channel [Echinicola arenosa]MBD8488940.1 two pore domain potassium channel family protein [Echinicola arenosa]